MCFPPWLPFQIVDHNLQDIHTPQPTMPEGDGETD
jgi:hypothetical protein